MVADERGPIHSVDPGPQAAILFIHGTVMYPSMLGIEFLASNSRSDRMEHPSLATPLRSAATLIAALWMGISPSGAVDIHVFTSGAPSAVQKAVAEKFTQATGHHVIVTA